MKEQVVSTEAEGYSFISKGHGTKYLKFFSLFAGLLITGVAKPTKVFPTLFYSSFISSLTQYQRPIFDIGRSEYPGDLTCLEDSIWPLMS